MPSSKPLVFSTDGTVASAGTVQEQLTGLLVIVDYPDKPNPFTTAQLQSFCDGAAHDYFRDTSYGSIDLHHIVKRYTMSHAFTEYTSGDAIFDEILNRLLLDGFDFSQLSTYPDDHSIRDIVLFNPEGDLLTTQYVPGVIRNLPGAQTSGYVWINNFGTEILSHYIIHELGHTIFRFADLKETIVGNDGYFSNGVGTYCLYGPNPIFPIPQRVNPYYMMKMGWITPRELTALDSGSTVRIPVGQAQILKYTNPANPKEYFLIESTVNRGFKVGNKEGLYIWHIDEDAWKTSDYPFFWSQDVSNEMTPTKHYTVSIEQADYQFDLESFRGTDATDVFAAEPGVRFTDFSYPDARWWNNNNSGLSIDNIVNDNGTLSFTFRQTSAALSLSDPSVTFDVQSGATVEKTLTLSNSSPDSPLEYAVYDVTNGYTWTDSDQGGVDFDWTSITGTGTLVDIPYPAESTRIALPFAFPFYGKTNNSVTVLSKGCLSFGSLDNLGYAMDTFPSLRMGPSMICPAESDNFWPDGDGDVIHVLNQSDKFVLQFDNIRQYEQSFVQKSLMTFQVILFTDGRIEFQYLSMLSPAPYTAVIGVQNEHMNRGVTVASRSSYIHDNLAVMLSPIKNYRLRVANTEGVVAPGASAQIPLTLDASNLAAGTFSDTLEIRHNGQNVPNPISIPVTTTVTAAPTATPCTGLCNNPIVFSDSHYQSGSLGIGPACRETRFNLASGNCSEMASRVLTVNGVRMNCMQWLLPTKRNGGYCIQVTPGTPDWSSFATW